MTLKLLDRKLNKTASSVARRLPASWDYAKGLLARHAQKLKRHAKHVRRDWR